MKSAILFILVFSSLLLVFSGCQPTPAPSPSGPTIANITPRCGNSGEIVVITGSGYGATQGASRAYVGPVEATVLSWSASEIQVRVPVGALTGNVTVQVAGVHSNGILFNIPCQEQLNLQVGPVNSVELDHLI